ncbi:MAG: PH domain-containing protein [Tepidisphaeraceae bacterium]
MTAAFSGIVLGAIAIIVDVATARHHPAWPAPLVGGIAAVVLIALQVGFAQAAYLRFRFALTDRELLVEQGVFWRVRRCVPRGRVQHVDLQSGPIDRALSLMQVHIFVAGGMGPVAVLPGVAPELAERLKEALVVERSDTIDDIV